MEDIQYAGQHATFGSQHRRHTFLQTFWKSSSNDGLEKVGGRAWSPWTMTAFGPLQADVGRQWAPGAAQAFNLVCSLPQGTAPGAPTA